jgi:hypothetical protein
MTGLGGGSAAQAQSYTLEARAAEGRLSLADKKMIQLLGGISQKVGAGGGDAAANINVAKLAVDQADFSGVDLSSF